MTSETKLCLPVVAPCDDCGACCMEQESPPGYLWIHQHGRDLSGSKDSDDVKRFNSMPADVRLEYDKYVQLLIDRKPHPNKGICIWFDQSTRKCKHYDIRPSVCREVVQVGDESCIQWRKEYGVQNG